MDAAALPPRAAEATAFLKSLAHRDRLLIACALVEGERAVGELEVLLDIRQPGLSQQLAGLRAAGLVATRRAGKAVFYRLADDRVAAFLHSLRRLFCAGEQPRG